MKEKIKEWMRDNIVKFILAVIFIIISLIIITTPIVTVCVICYKSDGQSCESKAFCDSPWYHVLKELEDNGWSCS